MVVIRSFPFGCITDHVDAVISTSSYRDAGAVASCGGERILSGRRTAWAPALNPGHLRVHVGVPACVVSDGTVYLPKNSLSVGVNGDRMSRASVLGQDEIAILEW